MGDYNERVNKRLRTIDKREQKTQDQNQPDTQQESDLYEHIKQGEESYDAQTYGKNMHNSIYLYTQNYIYIYRKKH